jgi:alpha-beta hydrolase superfamily lysophospholipase
MELLDLPSNSNTDSNNEAEAKPTIREEAVSLTSPDGLRIHMHGWLPSYEPDKVVITVHGMGGHGGYYATSLAPYLAPAGAAVYAPDLRGHGQSEGTRGDIESFGHFQQDVETAIRWARLKYPELPLFLVAESMGTSIAINFAVQALPEVRPDGIILIACVVAPTITPSVREVTRTLWYLATDRRRVALPITGREELGVRDPEFIKVLKSDALFNRRVSVRFLSSMTGYMQHAARQPRNIKLPVLLLQGGRDCTVRHGATRAFFARISAPDKEMHYFPEAYHAILNDPDSPQVRERILAWLERQRQKFQAAKIIP